MIVTFGETYEASLRQRIVRWTKRLEKAPFHGYRECVPSYTTLCIYFDVMAVADALRVQGSPITPYRAVCDWLEQSIEQDSSEGEPEGNETGRTVRVPVCYCSLCGPDLEALAGRNGLDAAAAAQLHAAHRYTVSMIGFMPGFPYMAGLPDALAAPRLETPRTNVPQGSVAIAGRQTGIYPMDSPGGWQLIGRTSVKLFRPESRKPSLFEVGDIVLFEAVPHEEGEGATHDIPC